jgi:hypothetical protein
MYERLLVWLFPAVKCSVFVHEMLDTAWHTHTRYGAVTMLPKPESTRDPYLPAMADARSRYDRVQARP